MIVKEYKRKETNSNVNNPTGFDRARDVDEPFFRDKVKFMESFLGNKVVDAVQTHMIEDCQHIDVKVKLSSGEVLLVDVKNRENHKNRNYSISDYEYKDVLFKPVKYEKHYLALIEYTYAYEGANKIPHRTGNFIICRLKDVHSKLIQMRKGKDTFWLLPEDIARDAASINGCVL